MSRYLKNQSGETIVEVLVSFVLLLMFTALFVVSLRYARTMSLKAETIRQTYSKSKTVVKQKTLLTSTCSA